MNATPPNNFGNLPVLHELTEAYKRWHRAYPHIPRLSRYTLGAKIDEYFIAVVEDIFRAGFAERSEKLPILKRASGQLDCLKWFLRVAWDLKLVDYRLYAELATPLTHAGKMIGGWIRALEKSSQRNNGAA